MQQWKAATRLLQRGSCVLDVDGKHKCLSCSPIGNTCKDHDDCCSGMCRHIGPETKHCLACLAMYTYGCSYDSDCCGDVVCHADAWCGGRGY